MSARFLLLSDSSGGNINLFILLSRSLALAAVPWNLKKYHKERLRKRIKNLFKFSAKPIYLISRNVFFIYFIFSLLSSLSLSSCLALFHSGIMYFMGFICVFMLDNMFMVDVL